MERTTRIHRKIWVDSDFFTKEPRYRTARGCPTTDFINYWVIQITLQWRHNEHDGVSNHQPHDCSLNRLLKCISKKTSKLRVTGLCEGNSPETGEFLAQRASNAENVITWWRWLWWHYREARHDFVITAISCLHGDVWCSIVRHFECLKSI